MSDETETPYAIGSADSIGLVVSTGICRVEYDLKQAQEEAHVKFTLSERDTVFETEQLSIGDNISLAVAEAAMDEFGRDEVYGLIVPDYLLGVFIDEYPYLEVYRQR